MASRKTEKTTGFTNETEVLLPSHVFKWSMIRIVTTRKQVCVVVTGRGILEAMKFDAFNRVNRLSMDMICARCCLTSLLIMLTACMVTTY